MLTRSRVQACPNLKCIIGGNSQIKSPSLQQSLLRISNTTSVGAEQIGRKRCSEILQDKKALQRVISCRTEAADTALYSQEIIEIMMMTTTTSTLLQLKLKAQGKWSNLDLLSRIVPNSSHCQRHLSACSNRSVTQRRICQCRALRSPQKTTTTRSITILMDEARKRPWESDPVLANRCYTCITIRSARHLVSWLILSQSLPDRPMWRLLSRSGTLTSLLRAHNISIRDSLTLATRPGTVRRDPQLKLSQFCVSQATLRTTPSQFSTRILPTTKCLHRKNNEIIINIFSSKKAKTTSTPRAYRKVVKRLQEREVEIINTSQGSNSNLRTTTKQPLSLKSFWQSLSPVIASLKRPQCLSSPNRTTRRKETR